MNSLVWSGLNQFFSNKVPVFSFSAELFGPVHLLRTGFWMQHYHEHHLLEMYNWISIISANSELISDSWYLPILQYPFVLSQENFTVVKVKLCFNLYVKLMNTRIFNMVRCVIIQQTTFCKHTYKKWWWLEHQILFPYFTLNNSWNISQLLHSAVHNTEDKWKVKVIYCHWDTADNEMW